MIEQVQYYETYLHRNPHQSNREEYLDDLSARGYFPATTEERAQVHAAHQNYRDALGLYRAKLGLPPDFVPHLQSWRVMDVPVDLEIPLFLGYMKALPPALIRTKRIERISLEFNYLFRREKRREKLQEFRANWANAEKDTLATNLSLCDLREKYGREMTSEVIYFRSRLARNPATESLQRTLFAEGEEEKMKIYDAHQFFETSHDHYRARLGLPREKILKPIMIPRRQILPSIFK